MFRRFHLIIVYTFGFKEFTDILLNKKIMRPSSKVGRTNRTGSAGPEYKNNEGSSPLNTALHTRRCKAFSFSKALFIFCVFFNSTANRNKNELRTGLKLPKNQEQGASAKAGLLVHALIVTFPLIRLSSNPVCRAGFSSPLQPKQRILPQD